LAGLKEPYELAPGFEEAMLHAACVSSRFWSRVGHVIDPECMVHPLAKVVIETVRLIAKDVGHGSDSAIILLQRVARRVQEGKVTKAEFDAVSDLIDSIEDSGVPPVEAVIAELVPVLKRRMQSSAILMAHDDWAKRGDFSTVRNVLEKASRLGDAEVLRGTRLGPGGFDEIERSKTIQKLPTGVLELDMQLGGGLPFRQLGVWIGTSGGGKCHAAGQGLLDARGRIVRVEDVRVGDRLMGPDGDPRRVLRTVTGYDQMYRVSPTKGVSWRVNGAHVLTVYTAGKELVDVAVEEYLRWGAWARAAAKLVRVALDFPEAPAPLLDPYLLGVILGDGSTTDRSLMVTTADPEIVEVLRATVAGFGLRLSVRAVRGKAISYGLAGDGGPNPILQAMAAYGLRGRSTRQKFVPECYRTGARWVRLAMLAGLLDTDGHHNGRGGFDFISGSEQMSNDVVFMARSLGLAAYLTPCWKRCQTGAEDVYYRVCISGETSIIPCRIERKKAPARRQVKSVLRTGFTVEVTGIQERYYGFVLDGDQRYLLDDFTVTHNSMALATQAAEGVRRKMFVGFVTLELPESVQLARLFANLTAVPTSLILDNDQDRAEAKRRIELVENQIGLCEVAEFAPHATTVKDLVDWVDSKEQEHGMHMELLVVDYGDKLHAPAVRDNNEYLAMRYVYEGLRRDIAVERGMWVWTGSQASRPSKDTGKRLDLHHVADSMHKVRVADLVITLNPKEDGMMELYVAKNRMGRSLYTVGPLVTDLERARLVPVAREIGPW
jgi:hypothetical protein